MALLATLAFLLCTNIFYGGGRNCGVALIVVLSLMAVTSAEFARPEMIVETKGFIFDGFGDVIAGLRSDIVGTTITLRVSVAAT